MGVSIQNRTSSAFERFVFMITRVLAFSGAIVVLAGIVFLAIALISTRSKATMVTYNDVAEELNLTDKTGDFATSSATSTPSVKVEIPNNLRTFFSGKNSQVLQNWVRPLSESQKRDFLNNLSAVLNEAQRKFAEREDQQEIQATIVNKYKDLKLAKLNQNGFEKYEALATKAAYVAGIFGLLLILSILSLVLVMLAIERNTRPDRAFSNRQTHGDDG